MCVAGATMPGETRMKEGLAREIVPALAHAQGERAHAVAGGAEAAVPGASRAGGAR